MTGHQPPEPNDFTLNCAVARRAAGQDVGVAIGDDACGGVVLGDIEEALECKPDVVIDYTHPSVRMKHVRAAIDRSIPMVIGTTGITAEDFDELDKAARTPGIGLVTAMSPIRPNVVWAMDFQFDTTAEGRQIKMLNIIDEFTRECLAIEVDRSIDADRVVDVLDRLARRNVRRPRLTLAERLDRELQRAAP